MSGIWIGMSAPLHTIHRKHMRWKMIISSDNQGLAVKDGRAGGKQASSGGGAQHSAVQCTFGHEWVV